MPCDRRDEQNKKKNFKREFPKIELGAIFDTVCKKCGGKGITCTLYFFTQILPVAYKQDFYNVIIPAAFSIICIL